jgi:type VI secretion system protein ImpF
MAEHLPPQDRLQPALLDRLTDDHPGHTVEARAARVLSKRQMRAAVLRDLEWLFNATQLNAGADLAESPYVRRSVLNFGLPAMAGKAASSIDVTDLVRAIREAILNFEPRILPASLAVTPLLDAGALDHHNVIGVEIHGHLWAQPVPFEFLIRTDFDLETGSVRVTDLISAARVP